MVWITGEYWGMRSMLTGLRPETLGYIFSGDFLDFEANINNGERIPAV